MAPNGTIGIIAAVSQEIKFLRKNMRVKEEFRKEKQEIILGSSAGKNIVLIISGIGKDNARRAVNHLIAEYHPCLIISCGFAGGLDERLKSGDLIVRAEQNILPKNINFFSGEILTLDHIVYTPEEKRKIFQKSSALCMDMESAHIGQIVRKMNIPFMNVRAIFDDAHEDISILKKFHDPQTGPDFPRLIVFILTHPSALIKLLSLRQKSLKGAQALNDFLEAVLST